MWGSVEDDYWEDIHKIMVCEPVLKMIPRRQKKQFSENWFPKKKRTGKH
jgi:hypothetical protein